MNSLTDVSSAILNGGRLPACGGAALSNRSVRRRGFTLIELLVTIMIIAILSSFVLGAMYVSQEQAREARTRALIQNLNESIMLRWESYRTRRLPVNTAGFDPNDAATMRLYATRELMRLEMPQRFQDFANIDEDDVSTQPPGGTVPKALASYITTTSARNPTSLSEAYRRTLEAADSYDDDHQGAECLYMIITIGIQNDDPLGRDKFKDRDIGDVDNDGMLEFHDGWGRPISFLPWAPGFISDLQPDPTMPHLTPTGGEPNFMKFARDNHDPFDPLRLDSPTATGQARGYRLFPLIYSPGADGVSDIWGHNAIPPASDSDMSDLNKTNLLNDPYYKPTTPATDARPMSGTQLTPDTPNVPDEFDPQGLYLDNIHNHTLSVRSR